MRTLIALSVFALLASGCVVGIRHHRSHRHSWGVGIGYHSHHHWNSSGPAYDEIYLIDEVVVLPVRLPARIDGELTPEQEKQWRSEWPRRAAELIAEQVSAKTDKPVKGRTAETAPATGYYIDIQIEQLDVGDKVAEPDPDDVSSWSNVFARGRLVNAGSGELVAEIKFREQSTRKDDPVFEQDVQRIGESLSIWFNEKGEETEESAS
jgi:hypothetical protein